MTAEQLTAEIQREAPHLRIVQVGELFGHGMDAIVQNRWGQCLWSVYQKYPDELPGRNLSGPGAVPLTREAGAATSRSGQKSLF